MATNKHAIVRYLAIDKCLSNPFKRYTFENLREACTDAIYEEYGDDSGISIRTLRDDLKFMRSEAGSAAPIEVMKDLGKPYYYKYSDPDYSYKKQDMTAAEAEQIKTTIMMLSRFKGLPQFDWLEEVLPRLESSFKLRSGVEGIVGFEQNLYLRGLEHFTGLFNAIVNKQVLEVNYCAGFENAKHYIIHPYHLKQYNNRWFLFGLCGDKIMNMPFDRIENFVVSKQVYIENNNIDFNEYFDDVIGVSVPYDEKAQVIELKIDKKRYSFIETKPLHPTQKVKERTDTYVIIELKLIPNYEFRTLLLGFADSIEIINPLELKKEIIERAKDILKKNI